MKVRFISSTQDVGNNSMIDQVAIVARVSNPANQYNLDTAERLVRYLIKNQHWSPFEMVNVVMEIETTRDIARQILRHRSFSFQEFSQRYSKAQEFELYDARRQDLKNKQNSVNDLPIDVQVWFRDTQLMLDNLSNKLYNEALDKGIAKECARSLLPLNTKTKLYMNGTIRSFIHYVEVRTEESTQLEHREIANQIKQIMIKELPTISKAMNWI